MRYHGTSPSTSCRHPPTPSSPPSAAAHSYVLRCTQGRRRCDGAACHACSAADTQRPYLLHTLPVAPAAGALSLSLSLASLHSLSFAPCACAPNPALQHPPFAHTGQHSQLSLRRATHPRPQHPHSLFNTAHSLHPLRGFLLNPSFCWNSRLAAAGCRNARSHPPHAPAHCNVKPLYILYTLQQADGKGAFDS